MILKKCILAVALVSLTCSAQAPIRVSQITIVPKQDPVCVTVEPKETTIVTIAVKGGLEPYNFLFTGSGTANEVEEIFLLSDITENSKQIQISSLDGTQSTSVTAQTSASPFAFVQVDMETDCEGGGIVTVFSVSEVVGVEFGSVRLSNNNGFDQTKNADMGAAAFNNLRPGTYLLEAIPLLTGAPIECNTSTKISFTIPDTKPLKITSITTTAQTSSPENGTITVSVEGGNPPYVYSIDSTDMTPTNDTTVTASGFSSGTFDVSVIDDQGCEVEAQAIVNLFENEIANYIAVNAKYGGTNV